MRRLSITYRLFATLVVATLTWAVVLPVVHLACAMQPEMMAVMCEHDADLEQTVLDHQAAHEAGHEVRGAPVVPARASIDRPSRPASMTCCLVEASPSDRPATLARVEQDVSKAASLISTYPRTITVATPPAILSAHVPLVTTPPPPLSPAVLSVFLI